jgi:hypothetical protein
MGRQGMLSVLNDGVLVTQYSPAVFDAFLNQIKASPSFELLTRYLHLLSSPSSGSTPRSIKRWPLRYAKSKI